MKAILKRLLVLILIIMCPIVMLFYVPTIGLGGVILLGFYWVLTGNDVESYIDEVLVPIESMYKLIEWIEQL